jgi:UDP-N-acetylglucosamine--N-acetylmuramyl-(pentapeptide) pyrophosphoryl-undecaprenol N-acetylglucosamine transferase
MKILITGGGTGGHVSPAVAVITRLRELSAQDNSPLDLHYVGSVSGIERRTMEGLGVPYTAVQTGKLRRYLSMQTPVDLLMRLPLGAFQALNAVRRFRPDVIFSTGGYVCVPTVIAGWMLRVPALTHEQTALVGLANRIAGRFARRVAVSYAQSARYFPAGKVVITGNPIRPSLLEGDAARGAARFGFDPAMPTVYVTGGAQGSHALNMAVEEALPDLLGVCQVIHQCGEGPDGSGADLKSLQVASAALPPHLQERYCVQAFVGDEIADVYALASLVVGRAGAGTVNELANLGKPSILVPLPGAKEQAANAHALEAEGASVTIVQEELTPRSLTAAVTSLISQPEKLASMGQAAHKLSTVGAADRIIAELVQLAKAS